MAKQFGGHIGATTGNIAHHSLRLRSTTLACCYLTATRLERNSVPSKRLQLTVTRTTPSHHVCRRRISGGHAHALLPNVVEERVVLGLLHRGAVRRAGFQQLLQELRTRVGDGAPRDATEETPLKLLVEKLRFTAGRLACPRAECARVVFPRVPPEWVLPRQQLPCHNTHGKDVTWSAQTAEQGVLGRPICKQEVEAASVSL